MVKLTAEKIKIIVQTFLDAAHNKKFQGKWMTPDTWAKLIYIAFISLHLTVASTEKLWCIPLEEQSAK
jgi:hypothetical protein